MLPCRLHLPLPPVRPDLSVQSKRLGAGVIDGRGIWADDGTALRLLCALRDRLGADQPISVQVCMGPAAALSFLCPPLCGLAQPLRGSRLAAGPPPARRDPACRPRSACPLQTSTSLQHVPYDLSAEPAGSLPQAPPRPLAFALQKLGEVGACGQGAPFIGVTVGPVGVPRRARVGRRPPLCPAFCTCLGALRSCTAGRVAWPGACSHERWPPPARRCAHAPPHCLVHSCPARGCPECRRLNSR